MFSYNPKFAIKPNSRTVINEGQNHPEEKLLSVTQQIK